MACPTHVREEKKFARTVQCVFNEQVTLTEMSVKS